MQMTKVSQKAKPKRRRLAGFLAELEDDAQVVPILLGSFMKIPLPTLDWVERKLHIVSERWLSTEFGGPWPGGFSRFVGKRA
jgi:hypothetical protein